MRLFSYKEILLLAAGLSVLGFVIFCYFEPKENPVGIGSDSYEFWHLSSNLRTDKEFAYTDLKYYPLFNLSGVDLPGDVQKISCTARVPGYPFLLALLRYLWDDPGIAIIFNILAYIGICLYGFLLGRMFLLTEKSRWIYNILIVFSPFYFIRWGIGADYAASLALTGFAWHLFKTFHTDSRAGTHVILAGLWGVLAVLTRVNLLIFTITLTVACFLWGIFKKQPRLSRNALMILLIITLGTGLWMARNKKLTGQWLISTQSGFVLYAVHISYDIDESNPLYYWFKQGRKDLLAEHMRSGKTFNQSEALVNKEVKSVTINYLRENPSLWLKKITDCLRTLFLFSYYDISDILVYSLRPWPDRLQYLQDEDYQSINPLENIVRQTLFQISRIYKILLALGFFSFLFISLLKNAHTHFTEKNLIRILYITTLLAVLTTAFFTGAGGDRLRMPFNAFILLFAMLFWANVFKFKNTRQ